MRVRLLGDIGEVFVRKGLPEVLLTQELLAELKSDETMAWGAWRPHSWSPGEGLRDVDLAAMLKPFAIAPHSIKVQVGSEVKVRRGYRRRQFFDPWSRYVEEARYARYAATTPGNDGDQESGGDAEGSGVAPVAGTPGVSEGGSLFDGFGPPGRNDQGEEMPF